LRIRDRRVFTRLLTNGWRAFALRGLGIQQLAATNGDSSRRLDADLHSVAAQAHDRNTDLVVDDDFLSDFPRENQHASVSFAIRSPVFGPRELRWPTPGRLAVIAFLLHPNLAGAG
jgi:hypothetical protein